MKRPIRKRFGQHFLAEPWARKVVSVIAPAPGDVFLEIGPGAGALTIPLASSGAPILAVEIDRDLAADLASRAPANVTVVTGDVLKTDVLPYLSGIGPRQTPGVAAADAPPRRFRVVGNLPYNLSTPIMFRLIELQRRSGSFVDATIMLGLSAEVTRLLDLPPGAFKPAPKVHSSVVRLTFRPAPVRIVDAELFEQVVKRIFTQRRKTLANALKGLAPNPVEVLEGAGIDPRRRPETLDLQELSRLVEQTAGTRRMAVL